MNIFQLLHKAKKLSRWLNNIFADATLILFYVIGIGMTAFGLWLVRMLKPVDITNSYWLKPEETELNKVYFESPY